MEEFQAYSPEEIVLSNLEEVFARSMHSHEQEQAHLRELATEIAAQFTDSNSFLTCLPEHRLPDLCKGDTDTGRETLCRKITTWHRICLCTELEKQLPAMKSLWQEFFFPETEEPDRTFFNRISYQKNLYTDAAYQQFSALLPEPRAAYAHGFASVCADVFNRLSEYCILPIENSSEGRLNSFSKLISTYDLKIAAVCEVRTDKERSTRFALLRRTVVPLRAFRNRPLYFEFSCELSGCTEPEDVLAAARHCRLTLLRSDIFPSEYKSIEKKAPVLHMHAALAIGNGDFPAFLLYLAMEIPNTNFIGLYADLSDR